MPSLAQYTIRVLLSCTGCRTNRDGALVIVLPCYGALEIVGVITIIIIIIA